MAQTNSDEILHDFFPLVRVHKDGRVERFGPGVAPPSFDQETNVQSKDIVISPDTNLSARLYLPKDADKSSKKLPLLVYFHGGGFVSESAFSPLYHNHLNHLVSQAQVVALSVDYRLAPEHPLPAAYEDAWKALKWVASGSENEDWIKEFADLDQVYLGGDSSGGNIAHHVAMQLGSEKIDGIHVRGLFLNCAMFGGEVAIGNEESSPQIPKIFVDSLWRFACPNTTGCDDPKFNPATDTKLSTLGCKKVLVLAAENDLLRDRGFYYEDLLKKSEWDGNVEIVEAKGEGHLFSVFAPTSENGASFLKKIASFIHHN